MHEQCEHCLMLDGVHTSDCPLRAAKAVPGSPHEQHLAELSAWMRDDPDVAIIARAAMAKRGAGRLADLGPEILAELHQVVAGFLEETPTVKEPGFFMGRHDG